MLRGVLSAGLGKKELTTEARKSVSNRAAISWQNLGQRGRGAQENFCGRRSYIIIM